MNALPSQQRGLVFSSLLLITIIAGMVLFALYLVKLDRTITHKFEGKRWDIPAKVYSQPLELYQGANIDRDTMKTWLELLNYQSNKSYDRTGTYHRSGNTYFIHTRGFTYSSSDIDAEQVIKMTLAGNKVDSIQSTLPAKSGIIRLEPVSIGGIYPDSNEDRMVVSLDDVPQPLIDALIATEDRAFYEHKGVSIRGIARAVINNFTGGARQGGSTITQQLIKNFYLNSDRTLKRKANEALMAVLLELHYSKDEILQTYLNEIYLGQNGNRSINGFGLASQFYFDKPLNELRIDQQAMLVGMAKGPSIYNPRRNPNDSKARRDVVLGNMLAMGTLSQEDYDKALKKPLGIVDKPAEGKSQFPDFLDIVKRELNDVYYSDDLKNEGLI
ncbi:MAG: transglycosylase domain-containing protein, partial [Pseudomonadota bacterium]|nr:transglycosylase domain-containing protein [Pseudomonadota bacterium]